MLAWSLLHYGYLIVFFGTVVEGDGTLLAAAFLAHQGYFRLPWLVAVSVAATTLANQAFYAVAKRHGAAFLEKRRRSDPRFAKVVRWMRSRGTVLLLLSRFLWGLRAAIPAACGATGMNGARFFVVNLAGALLWSVPIALLGYGGAHSISRLSRGLLKYEWQMAAALLFGGLLFVLWKTHGEELKESWKAMRAPDDLGVVSVELLGNAMEKQ